MADYISMHTGGQIDEVVSRGLNGEYTPPTALSELTEDSTHRIVTDAEKNTWNGKSSVSFSQTLASGTEVGALTIDGTETKLYAPNSSGAVESVNGKTGAVVLTYSDVNALSAEETIPSALSELTEDSMHRVVTDQEKEKWNGKSNFSGSYNDLTNKPTIPTALSELSPDSTHRTVTDQEKASWDGKSVVSFSQTLETGVEVGSLVINGQSTKLYAPSGGGGGGGAVESVNGRTGNVVLTASDVGALPAETEIPTALSELTEDSTHRVVTDAEKQAWNDKSNFSGNYNDLTSKPTIPTALSELIADSTHRVVTDSEKQEWSNKSDFSGSYNDLTNKPAIPTALSALTEDSTHRTVTDSEKATWNSKQSTLIPGDNITIQGNVISATGAGAGTSETTYNTTTANRTIAPNTAVCDMGGLTSGTITLGDTAITDDVVIEWNYVFLAGAGCSMTFNVPDGYTLIWKDGVPTWTVGMVYEISFRRVKEINKIIALVAENELGGVSELVPIMTSNTTPAGQTVIFDTELGGYLGYYAFDNSTSSRWSSDSVGGNKYLGVRFDSAKVVKKMMVVPFTNDGGNTIKNFKVQASNNGMNWTDLFSDTMTNLATGAYTEFEYDIQNNNYYTYYRLYIVDSYSTVANPSVFAMQFYGY